MAEKAWCTCPQPLVHGAAVACCGSQRGRFFEGFVLANILDAVFAPSIYMTPSIPVRYAVLVRGHVDDVGLIARRCSRSAARLPSTRNGLSSFQGGPKHGPAVRLAVLDGVAQGEAAAGAESPPRRSRNVAISTPADFSRSRMASPAATLMREVSSCLPRSPRISASFRTAGARIKALRSQEIGRAHV